MHFRSTVFMSLSPAMKVGDDAFMCLYLCSHGSGGGKPDARGPGRKRKGMEAADEASSETTGRDAADGDVPQCGIGAVASAGGSGKDIAFFQVRAWCCFSWLVNVPLVGDMTNIATMLQVIDLR